MSNSKAAAVVLSIAGSDNSAGAGIQADIKTGAAFGVYVTTAITAITAQAGTNPVAVYPVNPEVVVEQMEVVLSAMNVAAIKLGMLASAEHMQLIAHRLTNINVPVVVDPVLTASAGGEPLCAKDAVSAYQEYIFPLATIITPNTHECAAFLGVNAAATEDEVLKQGEKFKALSGAEAVLVKGGHTGLRLATDYLFYQQQVLPYSSPWLQSKHTHGTGCTLSTAIAAGLAQQLNIPQAVAAGKSFIQGAINHAQELNLVPENGPLHHFYQYW